MFTVTEIKEAHSKVKSGADFPKYIQEIKLLGVLKFETFVEDSHTNYFGQDNFQTSSPAVYEKLTINPVSDSEKFKHYLKIHQAGQTDYLTFCQHCAETGIQKWIVDLNQLTCIYYDKNNQEILVETIPS